MSNTTDQPTPRRDILATSCDKHIVHLITSTAPGGAADVRVTELKEPRDDMKCSCMVPAQWMIRSVPQTRPVRRIAAERDEKG